ncbi:MAG: TMEM175 family protein [Chloroflexi bacterium]|nr:TMEM175 family protein [Chloroflexota bacterium]
MPENSAGKPRFVLTTRRIEALADCIFAFAMTLLVLNLALPDAIQTKLSLSQLLVGQWTKFFNYVLSFALLAIFWIVHHQQFHVIRRTDRRHVWINIGILMFVALMPFSTDVAGDYSRETLAELLFSANLMILGLLFLLNWVYACSNHRLIDPDLDRDIIMRGIRRSSITPVVAAVSMVLSLFLPRWGLTVYMLIPLIQLHPWFRERG